MEDATTLGVTKARNISPRVVSCPQGGVFLKMPQSSLELATVTLKDAQILNGNLLQLGYGICKEEGFPDQRYGKPVITSLNFGPGSLQPVITMRLLAALSLAAAGATLEDENAALRALVADQALELSKLRAAESNGQRRKLQFGAVAIDGDMYSPMEPAIPGMMPGTTHPRILLGIDTDYPPYATLVYPPEANDTVVGGFGPDIAKALMDVCDIEVTTIEAKWAECWGDAIIGDSLRAGYYHGCETYTHTIGARNRFMEFSAPILDLNKEAGFIARLDADGKPMVSMTSDLSDVVVVDVTGWAPTADTVTVLKNTCSGEFYDIDWENDMLGSDDIVNCVYADTTNVCEDPYGANDKALTMLFNGEADAIYIYSDQAHNYIEACEDPDQDSSGLICDAWTQLGEPNGYAYIATGLDEYAYAGTTLAMAKKGAGLKDILDPCIEALIETEQYYEICEKWSLADSCFQTEYFPDRRNRARRLRARVI